jgi:hypothetical protein
MLGVEAGAERGRTDEVSEQHSLRASALHLAPRPVARGFRRPGTIVPRGGARTRTTHSGRRAGVRARRRSERPPDARLASSASSESGPVHVCRPLFRFVVEQRDRLAEQPETVADRPRRVVHARVGPAELAHEVPCRCALVEDVHADEPDTVPVHPVRRARSGASSRQGPHHDAHVDHHQRARQLAERVPVVRERELGQSGRLGEERAVPNRRARDLDGGAS